MLLNVHGEVFVCQNVNTRFSTSLGAHIVQSLIFLLLQSLIHLGSYSYFVLYNE